MQIASATIKATKSPRVVEIAEQVADLNKREAAIKSRMNALETEHDKLDTELSGIQTQRLELRREFDAASQPIR